MQRIETRLVGNTEFSEATNISRLLAQHVFFYLGFTFGKVNTNEKTLRFPINSG